MPEEPLEGLSPPPEGPLRRGYTTGACATAAAKAALIGLLDGAIPERVSIRLPRGEEVVFAVHRRRRLGGSAFASVVKDAGSDPDVTHGAEICADVALVPGADITLLAGEGVGTVTKPGLGLAVGGPAINPVPRRMITEALVDVLRLRGRPEGVRVVLSIPGGEELARRTLNPRLGIMGGLSILGTTGIVEPYSTSSYRASIAKGMDVARALGADAVVLATGRRTERFAQELLALPDASFVEVADFMGYGLQEAQKHGFRSVFVAALVGKMAKLAKGEMETHSRESEVDFSFLAGLLAAAGAPPSLSGRVAECRTARAVLELAVAAGLARFPVLLAELAGTHCRRLFGEEGELVLLFFDFDGTLLAQVRA